MIRAQVNVGTILTLQLQFSDKSSRLINEYASGVSVISVEDPSAFSASSVVSIGPSQLRRDIQTVQSISGLALTLAGPTLFGHPIGTVVLRLADPATVALVVTPPTGSPTTYNLGDLTRASVGLYSREYTFAVEGTYTLRCTSTGAGNALEMQIRSVNSPVV